MTMYSLCQSCSKNRSDAWNVKQAEFNVGAIDHWKVMLCPECMDRVEEAVLKALKPAPPTGDR